MTLERIIRPGAAALPGSHYIANWAFCGFRAPDVLRLSVAAVPENEIKNVSQFLSGLHCFKAAQAA
jgi:hypothetical protein